MRHSLQMASRTLSRRSLLGGLVTAAQIFSSPLSTAAAESPTGLGSLPPLRDGDRRLYLVRHGETDWNLSDRIQGRTDNPLNDNGRAQAEALSKYLANELLDLITSSNLQRAAMTADAVAARHSDAKRAAVLPEFAEMSFGDLEGAFLADVAEQRKAYFAAWREGESGKAWPGARGESPDDVVARGLAGLRSLGLLPSEAEPSTPREERRRSASNSARPSAPRRRSTPAAG